MGPWGGCRFGRSTGGVCQDVEVGRGGSRGRSRV